MSGSRNSDFPVFTHEEVARHASPDDCWVIVRGSVHDVSLFLSNHPGGPNALSRPGRAGHDVTEPFLRVGHSSVAIKKLQSLKIGRVVSTEVQLADVNLHGTVECDEASRRDYVVELAAARHADETNQTEDDALLPSSSGAVGQVGEVSRCCEWHSFRRARILESHPEVEDLLTPNPWTLLLIPVIMLAHGCGCMLAMSADHWIWTFVLAYTVGALCKMWQFGMAHEVCHGNIAEFLDRCPRFKHFVLHVSALPAIGTQIFDYYLLMHLGHHAEFGRLDENAGESLGPFDDHFDGDVTSKVFFRVQVGNHLIEEFNASPLFRRYFGHCLVDLHQPPYLRLLVFDAMGHIWHFAVLHVIWGLAVGLGFIPWLAMRLLFADWFKAIWLQAKKDATSAELEEILWRLGHMSFHPWLCLMVNYAFLQVGAAHALGEASRSTWLHGIMYLALSEMFYTGFLFHPYGSFWLATHSAGSGSFDTFSCDSDHKSNDRGPTISPVGRPYSGQTSEKSAVSVSPSVLGIKVGEGASDGLCQPTMSTYSWCSAWMSANLTFHVEHHDFPKCPWNRLPQVRQCAPEFYDGLRQSKGFLHTLHQFLRHGHGWRYSCLS